MHYDLRTEADAPAGIGHENWKDMSQRILNVMMPDTDVPMKKLLMLIELTVLSVAGGDDSLHRTMKLRNIK